MSQTVSRFEVATRFQNGFEVIVPAARANELLALVPNARVRFELKVFPALVGIK